MSFSKKVKEELSQQIPISRHCKIAELAAIVVMCGRIRITKNHEYNLYIHTENVLVARKYYILIKKLFNVNIEVFVRLSDNKRNSVYIVVVNENDCVKKILKTIKLMNHYEKWNIMDNSLVDNMVIQRNCCKRAFLRGIFLVTGAISNPEKMYHFEMVVTSMNSAEQLVNIILNFNIEAKIIARKKYFVVYIKESEHIVDMLNIMEAHISLMELENIRILKEVRNSVNRNVNCETANINKTVNAASKQIKDIEYIRDTVGLFKLSEGLRTLAEVRIANPDMSLVQLGQLLEKPLGKSGVNHRLRKISKIADEIRENRLEDF